MTDDYEGHTPGPWNYDEHDDRKVLLDPKLLHGKQLDYFAEHFGDTPLIELHDVVGVYPFSCAYTYKEADARLIADAPKLLAEVKRLHFQLDGKHEDGLKWIEKCEALDAEVKRLREALRIEEQIVQAFYEYRMECCFDHCEAWMLEKGHRVMVLEDEDDPTSGSSEWAVGVSE